MAQLVKAKKAENIPVLSWRPVLHVGYLSYSSRPQNFHTNLVFVEFTMDKVCRASMNAVLAVRAPAGRGCDICMMI